MIKSVAAIRRATRFSPNHVDNDSIILQLTGEKLKNMGTIVNYYDENDLDKINITEDVIFTMARSSNALKNLKNLENNNSMILNSVRGVRNCHRENMMDILTRNNISTPVNITVSTEDYKYAERIASAFSKNKLWVKREGHINHREDIVKVYSPSELGNILKEFMRRGISKASVMEHIGGDEIKFYAVPEADYIYWYYANGHNEYPFSKSKLKNEIFRCANLFDLKFFGGDAIITPDGEIYFIDINDWPSFAPVREEASGMIAKVIFQNIEQRRSQKFELFELEEQTW